MQWLHTPKAVIDASPYTTAYQLATLLVHKQMDEENWDEAWNAPRISSVKRAWWKGFIQSGTLSAKKRLFWASFSLFPNPRCQNLKAVATLSTDFFWVDPRNKDEVLTVLKLTGAGVNDPDLKVALQKATNQISGGRRLNLEPPLDNLTDTMAFVTVILAIHGGHEVPEAALTSATHADADLAAALSDFQRLLSGHVEDWSALMDIDRDDSSHTPVGALVGSTHPQRQRRARLNNWTKACNNSKTPVFTRVETA